MTTIVVSFSLGDLKEKEKNMSGDRHHGVDLHVVVPFYEFILNLARIQIQV
jgi:hypothetical protein